MFCCCLSRLPVGNNKHPSFDWRGGGSGRVVIVLFSEVTLLILRKMAQQFCCQLEEDRLKQFNLDGGYHRSFSFNENYEMEYTGL